MKESYFHQTLNKWDVLHQTLLFLLLAILQVFDFNTIGFIALGFFLLGSILIGLKSKKVNKQTGNSDLGNGYRFYSALDSPILLFYIATSFGKGAGIASAFSTAMAILALGVCVKGIYHRGYKKIYQTMHLYLSAIALILWRALLLEAPVLAILLVGCALVQAAVALHYLLKVKEISPIVE